MSVQRARSAPSPACGQGNRIWKKWVRWSFRRAECLERAQQPFAFRFWSVLDPIPLPRTGNQRPSWPKQRKRLQKLHMRYPCACGGGVGRGRIEGFVLPSLCPSPASGGGDVAARAFGIETL